MKLYRWMAVIAIALGVSACGKDEAPAAAGEPMTEKQVEKKTDEPDAAINAGVEALKNNNVLAFLQTVAPPEAMDEMRAEFERSKNEEPPTEAQRMEFEETMAKLTADDAVDALMAELEPQLVQMSAQLPMMMGFGQMMAQQAVQENETLTMEQKTTAQESVTAAFGKLQGINFGDTELARQAVTIVVDTARELDLKTMDDMLALDFDAAMGKAGLAMAGTKEVLNVYGISIDEMLDSISTEVVSKDGENATVKVNYSIFGTPQSTETEMVQKDGRWYAANAIEEMEAAMADDADPSS